jgi:hypothetical protein
MLEHHQNYLDYLDIVSYALCLMVIFYLQQLGKPLFYYIPLRT